jgi:hypothetical protein
MMVIIEVALGIVLGVGIVALMPALLRGVTFALGVAILIAMATGAILLIAENWPESLYFCLGIAGIAGLCALTYVKRWDTRYSKASRDGA